MHFKLITLKNYRMNVGIITKIELMEVGEEEFTEVTFTMFSAQFGSETEKSQAGFSYKLAIKLKIPKIEEATSAYLHNLLGRKLAVQFTDGNGNVHTAGDATYPARLQYNQAIGGGPGDWIGYDVSITHVSPDPHTIAES